MMAWIITSSAREVEQYCGFNKASSVKHSKKAASIAQSAEQSVNGKNGATRIEAYDLGKVAV
jgi:hypothetical protein